MNRTEFMEQLEVLLQSISPGEKEEALQYYNDYFDDAGAENEQKVLEALGNPAKVAENIRRELLENQAARNATASDRALVEYGKEVPEDRDAVEGRKESGEGRELSVSQAGGENSGWPGGYNLDGTELRGSLSQANGAGQKGSWNQAGGAGPDSSRDRGNSTDFGNGQGRTGGSGSNPGMSGGMIALLAVLAVFASPFILGLLGIGFGLLAMWFGLILGFGLTALTLLIVLILLLIVGVMCIPVDPMAGAGVIGGGLICGALGLLFLMLTVVMAGIITPAIFKGIGWLFCIGKRRKEG